MNNALSQFDWNQARAFLATAEHGSLSSAARIVGQTQPTLSRQVSGLERALGVTLFERIGRTLKLTETGADLLEHFRHMGEAAEMISLTASGQSQSVEGRVSITASDMMSALFLPRVLMRLQDEAPGILIEIQVANEIRNLQKREADIAIRHVRPTQPDLIAKLVTTTSAHFYASPKYFHRHGMITQPSDLADAVMMGYEPIDEIIEMLNSIGCPVSHSNFRFFSNNGIAGWEVVKLGLCITVMTKDVADSSPEIVQILPELPAIPVPVWLVTHRELHTSKRIRIVYDALSDALQSAEYS